MKFWRIILAVIIGNIATSLVAASLWAGYLFFALSGAPKAFDQETFDRQGQELQNQLDEANQIAGTDNP